jgi:hypothetical protein
MTKNKIVEFDELISEIVVDCYDDDEQMTAFFTFLGDEIPTPCAATLLGMPLEVEEIGYGRAPGVVATCRRGSHTGEVELTALTFAEGSIAHWLQGVYLYYLGHDPGPRTRPEGWRLRSWADE